MKHRLHGLGALAVLLGLSLWLGACSAGNTDTDTLGEDPLFKPDGSPWTFAQFEPGIQVMPMPNDLVWRADANPASPAVQLPAEGALAPLAPAINSLNLLGLSPNMFLTVPLTGEVDASTVQATVFRLDGQEMPRTEASFQIAADHIDDANPATPAGILKLLPNAPFSPGAFYAVAIKMGLKDAAGDDVRPSLAMRALKQAEPFSEDSPYRSLEALRAGFNQGGLFAGLEQASAAVHGAPWTRDDVLVLWTFHTAAVALSSGGTLTYAPGENDFASVTGDLKAFSSYLWTTAANAPTWLTDLGAASEGPAPVSLAQLAQDYATNADLGPLIGYVLMTAPADPNPETATNEADPIDRIFFGQFQSPQVSSILAGQPVGTPVPYLLVTPRGVAPPYPTVVFQHGILRDKFDALLTARAYAAQGMATLAIDAPYHGWRFDEETGEPFLTADLGKDRLNAYQGAVDLWETLDVLGSLTLGLDADSPRFAAESLGTFIGSVFLSQDDRPVRIHLASPAGQLANVLDASRKKEVAELVASLGYAKGTTSYYVFLDIAQWLLDPVDGMYSGIGDNSTDELMAVTAYGDPIVNELSSFTFLHSIGVSDVTSVAPPFSAPGTQPGAYEYGTPPASNQVIHFFTLAPFFDPVDEPWYNGYSLVVQGQAVAASQAQAAAFLKNDDE